MVALFSAFLFAKHGIRKGAMIFILSSIALIGLFPIFFSLFVIM
jgi:ABC-type lipoprotein release transport system permease subunit